MQYCILCYDSEAVIGAMTQQEDEALMARLEVPRQKLAAEGKLGPVARLMPTTTATTLRVGRENLVIDGPFAETKEQLLGFYTVECATLEEAIEAARLLATEKKSGSYEIRPMRFFDPGSSAK